MSWEIQACLEEWLPKKTNSEEKKSFIKGLIEWKKKIALHEIDRPKIAVFSTDSFADKASLILVPLLASTGLAAPKFSEHEITAKNSALAKLESIPGLQTTMNQEEIKRQLYTTGAVILTVPEPINSSFKKIYPSEDILSLKDAKKLLCAIITIILISEAREAVFDINVGDGTFIKNFHEARKMAGALKKICSQTSIRSSYILSDMNQPLGQAIGNSLEIREALEILKGKGPLDILKIALELGTEMLLLAEKASNRIEAKKFLKSKIINGEALEKFKEIIEAQKGNTRIIHDYSLLPMAKRRTKIAAQNKGYVQSINMDRIYSLAKELGIFRKKPSYPVNHGSGFLFLKKTGDWVEKNDVLGEVYFNNNKDRHWVEKEFREAFIISRNPPDFQPFIMERNSEKFVL